MTLKYKLHIPAFLAILVFSLTLHVFWADNMLQQHKEVVIQDQKIILESIKLELSRNIVAGDLSVVYELLDGLKEIHKRSWTDLQFKNAEGKQIYPLSDEHLHTLPHTESDIIEIKHPITWGGDNDVLGTLTLDINWKKHEASQLERVYQLEMYAIIIMVLYFFGGVIWNHLIVISPLTNIKKAIKGLKSGNLKEELLTKRNDEFGSLSNAFYEMNQKHKNDQEQLSNAMSSIWTKEIRHRTVIDNMLDGLVTIDAKGNIDSVNKATEALFEYTSQELLGKNINILMPEKVGQHHDGYLEKHQPDKKSHVVNISRGVDGRKKDGTIFPIEISVNEITIKNKKLFVGIIRDITERKRAETSLKNTKDRLDYLLSSSRSVIYSCIAEGNFAATYISPNIKEQHGYEPEDFTGDPEFWVDHIHPEDKSGVMEGLSELFKDGYHVHEYRFQNKDGQYVWMHDELRLILDENGKPIEIIGSWLDVSQRKLIEQQQINMQKQLQQAKKMESIGQLTGGFAHDFNNLLTSMLGYCELADVKFSSSDEDLSRYLKEIQISGKRAQNLVDQLLSLSRAESGKRSRIIPVIFTDQITKIMSTMLPSSIHVSVSVNDNLSTIDFDPVRTQQLIMMMILDASDKLSQHCTLNINMDLIGLDNKIKLVPQHSLTGSFIQLSVIAKNDNASLDTDNHGNQYISFNEYTQTQKDGQKDELRLSLIDSSVNDEGGYLLINNVEGMVAEYKVLFHLSKQQENSEEDLFSIPAVNIETDNKESILIVDDEASVARFMAELLETRGYTVSVSNDGRSALENILNGKDSYDLIITDEKMPGISGIELSKKLHDINYSAPVILYTEADTESHAYKDEICKNGIATILNKPIDVMMLLTSIQKTLNPHVSE